MATRGRPPFINMAKGQVLRFFGNSKKRIFSAEDLALIVEENREAWRLPQRMSGAKFVDFLEENGSLREVKFTFAEAEEGFP